MSVLNQSGEEQVECPLCMEPLEVDDLHFYPCTCGYQICRFCWNRIREGENGLCPACRKAYPENPADFTPLSQEQVAAIKTEKKAREQKRRNKTLESRRALANVRVVQNNLVFVVGLPVRLADPEILKRQEYFGKYGKIHKVVINQSTTYAGSQGPSASAYVTYVSPADALRAIQGVNNVTLDGRVLKGSLGTTKYCANFMKNQPCPKPDCMYLHELGDPKASFTKEEMHAGLHQVYERKLHNQLLAQQRDNSSNNSSGNSSTNADKSNTKEGNPSNFIPTTVVTSSHINVVNSKSNKKECMNGSSGSVGSSGSSGSASSSSSASGAEAWPSLASPSHSPSLDLSPDIVNSQENGISESSSPTAQSPQPTKSKDTDKQRTKDSNGTKKNKDKKKTNHSSLTNDNNENIDKQIFNSQTHSVFKNDTQQYLNNELDELESDRHSLLENHDLLENNDHKLLEDDSTHNLLQNNRDITRHRDMMPQIDNPIMGHMKTPLVNGFGLLDRDMVYLNNVRDSHISQGLMDQKELLLRERSQSEMLMRQNELMARQHNVMVEPKHYMPTCNIGLDSSSELLGANYHPNMSNPNVLPPFGMRLDNSMMNQNSSIMNQNSSMMNQNSSMMNQNNSIMNQNSMSLGGSSMSTSALNMPFMVHNQNVMQQMPNQMVNGFDSSQSANEGRYLAENMDKFFTDFHKAQQMRLLTRDDYLHTQHNTLQQQHNTLQQQHRDNIQRMNNLRTSEVSRNAAASGDGDDDLDFDPFKETQKALAEMMESEMMHNSVSAGDNARRSRLPPPGFSHVNSFTPNNGQMRHNHHQGVGMGSSGLGNLGSTGVFSDWTQMDPAIVSSVKHKPSPRQTLPNTLPVQATLPVNKHLMNAQHQNKIQMQLGSGWGAGWSALGSALGSTLGSMGSTLGSMGSTLGSMGSNLGSAPPGFSPAKPPQRPAECIDAN